jgi:D-cysteine desulfhydrase
MPLPKPLPIAHLPTPLHALPRLSSRLGVELFVKRDDLTNSHTGGNKLRKLSLLLADALAQGATHVITCGGLQSNHARATALAARPLGLQPVLVLRTPNGSPADLPSPPTGNLLLDHIAGATLHTISPAAYRTHRATVMATIAADLTAAGHHPYVIPEGGSNAIGSLAYAAVVPEILAALPPGPPPDTIVTATGSGGTLAGLALGIAAAALPTRALGVAVCDDALTFRRIVDAITSDAHATYGATPVEPHHYDVLEGFQGRGYALTTPTELDFLRETAREDGLLLDPVYTNKAFLGLVRTLESSPGALGRRIVFIHTGGHFGLFAHAEQLAAGD